MSPIIQIGRNLPRLRFAQSLVALYVLSGCAQAPMVQPVVAPVAPEQKPPPPHASALGLRKPAREAIAPSLTPLLAKDRAVDWWLAFKFNAANFPGCGAAAPTENACIFGGKQQKYTAFSQKFVYASAQQSSLQQADNCIGTTNTEAVTDPVGATFGQIYEGNNIYYVVWNDQFYGDPVINGCGNNCSKPWGHSKGMLSWNANGEGLVMQVSTPSWPASGSMHEPRESDGNTLGCVNDNNVKVSQHFFSLKLTAPDVLAVLRGLQNASVVTDADNEQIVKKGGPKAIQDLVATLGKKTSSKSATIVTLSSGVRLISKPSSLNVPPWQMVSAVLGGVPLRTATWWASPKIPSTDSESAIGCWDASLPTPGPVEIATTGTWQGVTLGLTGGPGSNFNHAKLGVSTDPQKRYVITGDLNQQGALSDTCASSQNGRGGLFFVLEDASLFDSVTDLLKGDSAPVSR